MHTYRRRPLRQRITDRFAVAALFPFLLAAALWLYRGDRKAGQR